MKSRGTFKSCRPFWRYAPANPGLLSCGELRLFTHTGTSSSPQPPSPTQPDRQHRLGRQYSSHQLSWNHACKRNAHALLLHNHALTSYPRSCEAFIESPHKMRQSSLDSRKASWVFMGREGPQHDPRHDGRDRIRGGTLLAAQVLRSFHFPCFNFQSHTSNFTSPSL